MNKIDIERLLTKAIEGTILPEEQVLLDEWIKKSIKDDWEPDIDKAWNNVYAQIQQSKAKNNSIKRIIWVSGIAAAIVGLLFSIQIFKHNESEITFVAQASQLVERLKDGSEVTLTPQTTLQYKETRTSRDVILDGTAHFNVTANKQKPFVITAKQNKIVVVGTQFDVQVLDNDFYVQVYEGVVQVATQNKEYRLTKNDVLKVKDGQLTLSTSTEEQPKWINNELIFIDEPIMNVIQGLQLFYNRKIEWQGNSDNILVNTGFSTESFEEAIDELKTILKIRVENIGNKTVLINDARAE